MYRRRKSESAESSVSFGPSKVVIRIFSCAAGGLCFGYLLFQLTNSTLSYYLGALLFSALAYLVTDFDKDVWGSDYDNGFRGTVNFTYAF